MSISLNKKLNTPGMNTSFGKDKTGKTSVTAQATRNMANYSSATNGSSIFRVNQKHCNSWTPGVQNTPNTSKHNYQGVRQSLNSKGFTPSYGFGGFQTQTFQASQELIAFDKGMLIGQFAKGTFGLLNSILGADKAADTKSTKTENKNQELNDFIKEDMVVKNATTLGGQLSSVSSFKQINELETQVKNKKTNLDADYKALDPKASFDDIKGEAQEGLDLAGVTLSTDNLTLSNLDSNDLDASMKTIDSDYDKFGNFKTNELPAAKNSITTKSGEIKGQIGALDGQISQLKANNKDGQNNAKIAELKSKLETLKENLQKLQDAEKKIDELSSKCDSVQDELKKKKEEIKDIKDFEDKVKDKKYNLAKTQDKDLKKAVDKLRKLDAEIKKASVDKNGSGYDKKDDKRNNKLSGLNAERAAAFTVMSSLVSSLEAAGGQGAKIDGKGSNSYTISNLDVAKNYKPES